MSEGSLWQRIFSDKGFTAISHYYVMDWAAIWKDIVGGLLLAGALGAWVPDWFWKGFFFSQDPVVAAVWGPIVGPLVAVVSFVCSVGNVPLAAILWNGGIIAQHRGLPAGSAQETYLRAVWKALADLTNAVRHGTRELSAADAHSALLFTAVLLDYIRAQLEM